MEAYEWVQVVATIKTSLSISREVIKGRNRSRFHNHYVRCTFDSVDFDHIELRFCQFTKCTFLNCRFTNVVLVKSIFEKCKVESSIATDCIAVESNSFKIFRQANLTIRNESLKENRNKALKGIRSNRLLGHGGNEYSFRAESQAYFSGAKLTQGGSVSPK